MPVLCNDICDGVALIAMFEGVDNIVAEAGLITKGTGIGQRSICT